LLAVDNCMVTLVGKEMPADAAAIASTSCTEQWYDIPYSVGTVPEADVSGQWRAILHGKAGLSAKAKALVPLPIRLPQANPFLPSNFDLVSAADEGEDEDEKATVPGLVGCLMAPGVYKRPSMLVTSSKGQLWFKREVTFEQPKMELTLKIISPSIMSSPALRSILVGCMNDTLLMHTYDAEVAGLDFQIYSGKEGLMLVLGGYSHKVMELLKIVLTGITAPDLSPDKVAVAKERVIRSLENFKVERPDSHAAHYTNLLMAPHRWTKPALIAVAEGCTAEQVQQYHRDFVDGPQKRIAFVCGNSTAKTARSMYAKITKSLELAQRIPKDEIPNLGCTVLPLGTRVCHKSMHTNPTDVNSCLRLTLQLPPYPSLREEAARRVLMQLLKEPFFSNLRTKQQLGYICQSGGGSEWTSAPIQYINFNVVSKTHTPTQMEAAVDVFLLDTLPDLIENITAEKFEEHVSSMIIKMLEPPKTLGSVDSALFTEVSSGRKSWGRCAVIAEALKQVTKEDVAVLLNDLTKGNAIRQLSVHIHGSGAPSLVEGNEDDIATGKSESKGSGTGVGGGGDGGVGDGGGDGGSSEGGAAQGGGDEAEDARTMPWKVVSIPTGPEGMAGFRTSLQCVYTAMPTVGVLPGKL